MEPNHTSEDKRTTDPKQRPIPDQTAAFETLPVPQALVKFILPAVISQLAGLILNLTDTFFVGRTGDTNQISAMTICFPVIMMVSCTATIFAVGGSVNVAASLSSGNRKRAGNFAAFSVYMSAAVVIVLSLFLWAAKTPILNILGTTEDAAGFCRGYLLWTFHWGCVPLAFATVISQLFSAEGETRIAGIGIAGGGLLNAVLDPIFVFVLDLGVVGAGMATCISDYVMLIFFLIMYVRKQPTTVLSLRPKDIRLSDGIASRTLAIGLPAGLTMCLLNCCDFLRNYLLGAWGGAEELAAWGIVQKVGNACMQICVGIAQGVRPLVAYNSAAGKKERTRSIIRGAAAVMLVYCAAIFLLLFLRPDLIVHIFLKVEDVAVIAERIMRLWIVCVFGMGATELMNSIFQAMGHWKIALADVVLAKSGMFCLMLVLARFFSTTGVVISQPIVDWLSGLALIILYLTVISRNPTAAL